MNKEQSKNISVIKYMLNSARKYQPILFVSYFLRLLSTLLQKIQIIIFPKFILDELVLIYNEGNAFDHLKNVIFYVILTLGLQLIESLFNAIANRIRNNCGEWFDEYFQWKINNHSMSLDFELTENPEILNKLNNAKEGMSWYSGNVCGILDQFYDIIINFIVLLGTIFLLIATAPILIPFSIIQTGFKFIFERKIRKIQLEDFSKLSKSNRIFSYLYFELSNSYYGKDIRLYNSANLFNRKGEDWTAEQNEIWENQVKKVRKQNCSMDIISAIMNAVVYFYIGFIALKKIISIGDISMCLSSSNTFNQSIESIMRAFLEISKRSEYASKYLDFIQLPQVQQKGTKKILEQQKHEIEFKNVSFKYPRTENFVLKNINIKIPYGQHLAIVGLNGAGKTTFIKLLCRLYDVSEGEILIDGINIKEYSDTEYRKLFAILFQDFSIFAFTVKENISFDENVDDSKIDEILKLAGIYDDVQSLPNKSATCVSKSFDEDGTDFSGGQKQKLGIARALYKNSPIIIFDEPTAALDPIAEAEIYSKFNKTLAGEKTAIYISHRLSSCKFCDKIAVFSENEIKEYGSHKELMKISKGIYKEMFTTQAKQYQKSQSLENDD